jgi:hypothetical protein
MRHTVSTAAILVSRSLQLTRKLQVDLFLRANDEQTWRAEG